LLSCKITLSLIIEDFIHYITQSFGLPAAAELTSQAQEIPLYLKGNYEIFTGHIGNREVAWARVKDETAVTPDRLQDQKLRLQQYFNMPVVFIFDQLDSWQRKRLIERQIGFVQTNRQIYIPELFLQLNDHRSDYRGTIRRPEHLSFPAQVAILYHLQKEPLDQQFAQQIAPKLGYSAMTITRIIRELQQFDLVTVSPGKERTLTFKQSGQALWQMALPWLRSPVKETWFSYGPLGTSHVLETGQTALASYSMLAESRVINLAIGKEQFKSLQTLNRLPELNQHQGNYCLQVWQYDPTVIVYMGAHVVDKLSLYLALRSEQDERILASLEEMLKNMSW